MRASNEPPDNSVPERRLGWFAHLVYLITFMGVLLLLTYLVIHYPTNNYILKIILGLVLMSIQGLPAALIRKLVRYIVNKGLAYLDAQKEGDPVLGPELEENIPNSIEDTDAESPEVTDPSEANT